MMYDYLVVGSGLYGAIFAHEAKAHGKSVLVVDKRPNIAGNIYTENIEGINVHKYGAHIFHTNNKKVWNYITQFAEFNRFTNSPVANYKGELYSLPFNMYRGSVYKQLSCDNFIGSCSFPLLKSEALEKVGGFDPKMVASQDWDTWLRISKIYDIDYTEDSLIHYYIHKGERITGNTMKRLDALHRLDEKQKDILTTDKDVLVSRREYELRLYIQSKQVGEAIKCYFEIVAAKPYRVGKNIILLKAFGRFIVKRKDGTF